MPISISGLFNRSRDNFNAIWFESA